MFLKQFNKLAGRVLSGLRQLHSALYLDKTLPLVYQTLHDNNFEISLVVFIPNITTNHAITCTNDMKRRNNTINKQLTGSKVNLGEHQSKH